MFDVTGFSVFRNAASFAGYVSGEKSSDRITWQFTSFAKSFARMLGRTGDLSTFSTWELELLKKTYNRSRAIEKAMLEDAFEKASEKTLAAILYELRILIHRKEG